MAITGPMQEHIERELAGEDALQAYRAGGLSGRAFVSWCEEQAPRLSERIGGGYAVNVLARWPRDFRENALAAYEALRAEGVVHGPPDPAAFDTYRDRVRSRFSHGRYATFIHPDEAEAVYHVAKDVKPRRVAVFGAYYGYWAVWAMAGLRVTDGKAYLFDPNPDVCELAEENMSRMGLADRVEVIDAPAEEAMSRIEGQIDLALLDAAGAGEHPDPTYHGKGVYAHIANEAVRPLAGDGILITHNDHVALRDAHPFVARHYAAAAEALAPFHDMCAAAFRVRLRFPTAEGLGVYAKPRAGSGIEEAEGNTRKEV
jgi:predicted O-methyltransferase YrrM